MSNHEIQNALRQMVEAFGESLRMADKLGGLPVLKVTIGPRDGRPALRLVVGVEPVPEPEE